MGFCDVGGVTNQRYLMASFIPPDVICGHSVPTIAFDPVDVRLMALWLGVANSFAADYLARRKGALHLTFTIMDSLPLPVLYDENSPVNRAIALRALRLGAVGNEMDSLWEEGRRLLEIGETETRADDPQARARAPGRDRRLCSLADQTSRADRDAPGLPCAGGGRTRGDAEGRLWDLR
ncbi:hypothetical protein [Bradyrhizobium betae]|uniref:Uncharacterized protein n=1 Tax=Bradyrhizobium betae TaxID=244734 RepID=A0A5P6P9L0_9BRAD|nr:hypothetical protein [Bradyrhizobium betae]QFI74748.1 hypothetical protein F8237_21455 [Bradyrhizobium betae]